MNEHPPLAGLKAALHDVELPELQAHPAGVPVLNQRLGLFAGVKAKVEVQAGRADTTVGELLALREGAVLRLDRGVDAPFDVLLDGQLIARGELVAVGDHFGIRVTEVCEMPRP